MAYSTRDKKEKKTGQHPDRSFSMDLEPKQQKELF